MKRSIMTPTIQARRIPGPFDDERNYFEYEWIGDPTAPILLSSRQAADLPWPMAMIEEDYMANGGWYIRLDQHGVWYRRLWYITTSRMRRAWQWFTVRAVLTLYVWGLASYDPGRVISWRDVGIRRNRNA